GGGQGGIHIYRYYPCGILPGYGIFGGTAGGFHIPVSGGFAGNVGTAGGNAREGGISRISGKPPGAVLRAGGRGGNSGKGKAGGIPDGDRSGIASRRRSGGAGDPGHPPGSEGILGAGRLPGVPPAFSGHQLADQLFAV